MVRGAGRTTASPLRAGAFLFAALLLTETSPAAAAGLYRWVDQAGNVHYSDQIPPPEATDGHRELRKDGIEKQVVGPQKSREELLREQEAERLRAEQQRLLEKQQAADRALIETYRTEDDLHLTRDGKLAAVDAATGVTLSNLQRQKRQLAALQGEAAGYEGRAQPIPETLRARIAEAEQAVWASYESIVRREQEKDRIRDAFDQELSRYRALKQLASQIAGKPKEAPAAHVSGLADRANLVPCQDAPSCQALWARAKTFVEQRATTPTQLSGPRLHMSGLPKGDKDLSLTLAWIPNAEGQGGVLLLDIQCSGTPLGQQFCASPATEQVRKDFKPFLQQP